MKILLSAVFNNTGLSKANQTPYSIPRAIVLTPFQDVDNKNFQSHGAGFTPVELGVSTAFFPELKTTFDRHFIDHPVYFDVETALDREGRNIITGFSRNTDVHAVITDNEPEKPTGGLFGNAKQVK
jgi:hypothetical protein